MIYLFNDFKVDTEQFILQHKSKTVEIEPQVFDLIVYLIKNKYKVVSRDELLEHVWGGRVVLDATLNNHIKSARNALNDDGQAQRVIKTIHGRGYQFIAEVIEKENEAEQASITLKRRLPFFALIAIIGLSFFAYFKNSNTVKTGKPIHAIGNKSIAVLAFLDMSPEQDQEYFSDGVSVEILNKLTHIPELRVISQTSSFFYKDKDLTAKEIGDQLEVSHILEGSVRKSQDKVRITVQLIESENSTHVWSETYDKTMDNILQIQHEIASTVSERLKLSIIPKPKSIKVNPEAYTIYLQAQHLTQSGMLEDLIKSEQTIKQSIALDSNYAPAWHLLSRIVFRSTHGYQIRSTLDGDKAVRFAINKAIELDPGYAPSYATLARLENHQRNFSASEKNIQIALGLDSNNTYILNVAAHILAYAGKLTEALDIHEKIKHIDPKYFSNYLGIGAVNYVLNNQELAYEAYQKFEKNHPNTEIQQYHMCIVSLAMGKNQQALEHARKEKSAFWNLYSMNLALFAVGEMEQADVLFEKFIDEGHDSEHGHIARIYAFRGDVEQAFEALNKAIEGNDSSLIELLNYPDFRKMHNDPRWHELIRKMKFPDSHWLVKKLPPS